ATQNPIETEGTYALPEAQVDRFMMKVLVGYPSEEEEFVIVERVTGPAHEPMPVATTDQLGELQRQCRKNYVEPALIQYAVRLAWTVIRRLDGLLHGDYRTLFRGFGLDLADLREYQYGDDVRHIDWNVTARLQTPYVREYHEDREITGWFLLDLSRSVDFGSQAVKKGMVSADFVALLARLLTRHGNRVGAILYGTDVDRVITPRTGRRQVLAILHAMMSRPPLAAGQGTDLGTLLQSAFNFIHRRSLVFI